MKTTTIAKVAAAIKKAGLERSDISCGDSQIKGWNSHNKEGVYICNYFPWHSTYVRNGYYLHSYITDASQDIRVEWQHFIGMKNNTEIESKKNAADGFKKMLAVLDAADIEYSKDGGFSVKVSIANPFPNAAELNHKCEVCSKKTLLCECEDYKGVLLNSLIS